MPPFEGIGSVLDWSTKVVVQLVLLLDDGRRDRDISECGNAARVRLDNVFVLDVRSFLIVFFVHVSCEPLGFLNPVLLPFLLVEVLKLEPGVKDCSTE